MFNTDKESFSEIYDLCAPTAYSLACRILGNTAEAEDVVQHAFISLWRNAEKFDASKGQVSTWLHVFVRNRCIDVIRRRKSEKSVPLDVNDDGNERSIEFPDHSAGVETLIDDKEKRKLIRTALANLPDPQKRVIEAAYFEGRTQQEISEQFNEPLGTVKTRMRLGLMKLAELLKGQVHIL